MKMLTLALIILGISLTAGACGWDGSHPFVHECDTDLSYSSNWGGHELRLTHTESRLCPIDLDQHPWISSFGTVTDEGTQEGDDLYTWVYNSDGDLKSAAVDSFSSVNGVWKATTGVSWQAATGSLFYDDVRHEVHFLSSVGGGNTSANMTITYTDQI